MRPRSKVTGQLHRQGNGPVPVVIPRLFAVCWLDPLDDPNLVSCAGLAPPLAHWRSGAVGTLWSRPGRGRWCRLVLAVISVVERGQKIFSPKRLATVPRSLSS